MSLHLRVVVKQAKDFGSHKCSVHLQVGYEYNWIHKYYRTKATKPDKSGIAVWNVAFDCLVNNPIKDQLMVMLKNDDLLGDGMIGEGFVSLANLTRGVPVDMWITIFRNNRPRGQVNIEVTALDFGQVPVVTTIVTQQPVVSVTSGASAGVALPQNQAAYQPPMIGATPTPQPSPGLYPVVGSQPQMQSQMQSQMQPQMQSQMQPQMQSQMQSQMQPQMQSQMQPQMQSQMQPQMQPQTQPFYVSTPFTPSAPPPVSTPGSGYAVIPSQTN